MGNSILVTGSTGFIGSKLVSDLVKENYKVSTLVRKEKTGNPDSNIIRGDLTDATINFEEQYDCVYHLASHTPLEKNKKILYRVNLDGTKNLFNNIKDITKSILYVSGLGVYGDVGEKIVNESFPYNPDTEFARIRLEAQRYLEENCSQLGIRFAVVHFGDVYGPGGWFYNFLIQRLLKNMFRFPKGGDYYKGFIHIDDAVGSLISILKKNKMEGKFIVTDSYPAKFNEFVNYTADCIGIKHPGTVPIFIARALLGGDLIKLLTTSTRVSNKKINEIYEFKFPSYKEGIRQVISDLELRHML